MSIPGTWRKSTSAASDATNKDNLPLYNFAPCRDKSSGSTGLCKGEKFKRSIYAGYQEGLGLGMSQSGGGYVNFASEALIHQGYYCLNAASPQLYVNPPLQHYTKLRQIEWKTKRIFLNHKNNHLWKRYFTALNTNMSVASRATEKEQLLYHFISNSIRSVSILDSLSNWFSSLMQRIHH